MTPPDCQMGRGGSTPTGYVGTRALLALNAAGSRRGAEEKITIKTMNGNSK